MASFNKFNDFVEQVGKGVHDLSADTLKVALTNTAPVASQSILDLVTDHPPPAAANGYTTGGHTTAPTWSETAGVAKLVCVDVVITATAGGIGPFRYVILYNDTPTSPVDPLIGWWDYGSAVDLADTEGFTVDFDGSAGVLTLT